MERGLGKRIGKILGIELRIHYSWFVIFLLVSFSLADQFQTVKNWPFSISFGLGLISSLLLFVSIFLHELTHSFFAQRAKIPIKSITLFVFGGVAQILKEPETPFVEFKISILGPFASLFLALLFFTFSRLPFGAYFQEVFFNLSSINLLLVGFNLIPAFPLDGGRIFRSILWALTKNLKKATRWSTLLSHFFAFLLILIGFIQIFRGNLIGGLWLSFIGWFLIQAAEISFRQVLIKETLSKIKVSEIMTKDLKTIEDDKTLDDCFSQFLYFGQSELFVCQKEEIIGIITLADLKKVPKEDWSKKIVASLMTPKSKFTSVSPSASAFSALRKMSQKQIEKLPVISKGKIVGLLTQACIILALRTMEGE